jgi:hypothetical protein
MLHQLPVPGDCAGLPCTVLCAECAAVSISTLAMMNAPTVFGSLLMTGVET